MYTDVTAYLVIRRDDGFGEVFPLTPGQACTLGRDASNRIVLKDDLCSREHAEVSYADGRWRVHDLNSLNGTSLNGAAVESERELVPNDEVQLGRTRLLFVEDMSRLPEVPCQEDSAGIDSIKSHSMENNQPSPTTVTALRIEFTEWLRRYQHVLGSAARGSDPLQNSPAQIPATEWFGAMAKCCYYMDALVAACLKRLLPIAGGHGVAMVEKIAAGKPLDRLTLGQQVQILDALDKPISHAFWQLHPETMAHTRKVGGARLLGHLGVSILHQLSRMRNDFAHGRWHRDQAEREQFASEFPKAVSVLCNSKLVFAAMALELSKEALDTVGYTVMGRPHDSEEPEGAE